MSIFGLDVELAARRPAQQLDLSSPALAHVAGGPLTFFGVGAFLAIWVFAEKRESWKKLISPCSLKRPRKIK